MKKILFVVDENRRGGVSVVLEDVVRFLRKENCEIDILVLHDQGEMLNKLPKDIGIIYGTPFFEAIDYSIGQIIKKRDIGLFLKKVRVVLGLKTGRIERRIQIERKKILKKQYDVEIAFKDGFPAIFTAFGDTEKKIHWLHSEYKESNSNSKYEAIFQKILPQFEQIVSVSKGVEDQFNQIYHLEGKTTVIRNIVPEDMIVKKSLLSNNVAFEEKNTNIVLVGRCHSDKGYGRLLKVISKMEEKQQLENLVFHIIGDGPEEEQLHSYVKEHHLENRVRFYGRLENPYPYMKQADAVMLPSVNESFGLVAVEAQILGTPVIATLNAATQEVVYDGEYGQVVSNSEDGVEEGILILKDREKLNYFRRNLQNYVYDNRESINEIKRILGV